MEKHSPVSSSSFDSFACESTIFIFKNIDPIHIYIYIYLSLFIILSLFKSLTNLYCLIAFIIIIKKKKKNLPIEKCKFLRNKVILNVGKISCFHRDDLFFFSFPSSFLPFFFLRNWLHQPRKALGLHAQAISV